MGYAIAFANAINTDKKGPFAAEQFSDDRIRQFKFAALLHDMGKIGVPEALLDQGEPDRGRRNGGTAYAL